MKTLLILSLFGGGVAAVVFSGGVGGRFPAQTALTIPPAAVSSSATVEQVGRKNKRTLSSGDPTITICHATGSATNPYTTVTVSTNGNAHAGHADDIVPAPAAGCPAGNGSPAATPEPLTLLLMGAGLAGVGYAARRRSRKSEEHSE